MKYQRRTCMTYIRDMIYSVHTTCTTLIVTITNPVHCIQVIQVNVRACRQRHRDENRTCPTFQRVVNAYHCTRFVERAEMWIFFRMALENDVPPVVRYNIHPVPSLTGDRQARDGELVGRIRHTRAGRRAWRRARRQTLSVQARNPSWLRGLRREKRERGNESRSRLSLVIVINRRRGSFRAPEVARHEPCRRGKTGPTTSRSTKVASADGHT